MQVLDDVAFLFMPLLPVLLLPASWLQVVGSLDIFGDAVRLVHGLGLGVWHLFSMPAEGALRGGPIKFVAGLAGGLRSLVRGGGGCCMHTQEGGPVACTPKKGGLLQSHP